MPRLVDTNSPPVPCPTWNEKTKADASEASESVPML
jgi:hypothetical protein